MQKIILTLGILFTQVTVAQKSIDINGVWQDSSGTAFTNCTAIFAVKNDSVFYTHYLEFNKIPFVEYGKGKIKNGILNYIVTVSLQIPGWSTGGEHQLALSKDGLTLRGTYKDNLGNTGPLVFKKRFPEPLKNKP